MGDATVFYRIEAWIDAQNAVNGVGYWAFLHGKDGHPYRTADESQARKDFASAQGVYATGTLRLVRFTEEVVG